jgi:hypothetical protein
MKGEDRHDGNFLTSTSSSLSMSPSSSSTEDDDDDRVDESIPSLLSLEDRSSIVSVGNEDDDMLHVNL